MPLPLLEFLLEPTMALAPVEAAILAVARGGLVGTVIFAIVDRDRRPSTLIIAGLLMALIQFEMTVGLQLVDPRQIAWIMHGGDGRWHHTAWVFFRGEPWSMPPGRITQMLYPVGTSVANTDSIPLAAMLFKLFDPWLPRDFQYLGLWFLGSALLRGVFAALLASQLGVATPVALLATAMIVCGPKAIPSMDHAGLSGMMWLTLAALWLYFRRPQASAWAEMRPWLLLAGATAATHPYLCAMTVAQSAAGIARRWWPDRLASALQVALRFAAVLAVVLSVWWLAGYFLVPVREMTAGGLGIWSMDLLSFINPAGKSNFLPPLPMNPMQAEGSNYLGVGALLLVAWSAGSLLRRPPSRHTLATLAPLFLVCAAFLLFALSPIITFGGRVLLEMPYWLYEPLSPFRASGRFGAPVAITLLVLAIRVLARRSRTGVAAAVLLGCVVLQLYDTAPQRQILRRTFTEPVFSQWREALSLYDWEPLTQGRRELRLVPDDRWSAAESQPFSYVAARTGLACAAGLPARVDAPALAKAAAVRDDELKRGVLGDDILYVAHMEDVDLLRGKPGVSCARVDGYQACAVGLVPAAP